MQIATTGGETVQPDATNVAALLQIECVPKTSNFKFQISNFKPSSTSLDCMKAVSPASL